MSATHGTGVVLEALLVSGIPPRAGAVALLMLEKRKRDVLRAYVGDILVGLLSSLHSLGGSSLVIPTYSEVLESLETGVSLKDFQKRRKERTIEETNRAVQNIIDLFTKKEVKE